MTIGILDRPTEAEVLVILDSPEIDVEERGDAKCKNCGHERKRHYMGKFQCFATYAKHVVDVFGAGPAHVRQGCLCTEFEEL